MHHPSLKTTYKLVQGAVSPINQVINENIRTVSTPYSTLGYTTIDWPPDSVSQHFEYSFLSTSLLTYLANTSFYVYEYVMGYSVQSLASQDKQYLVLFPHPPRQPFPQKTLGLAKHLFTQATMIMPNHLLVLCKFAKVF